MKMKGNEKMNRLNMKMNFTFKWKLKKKKDFNLLHAFVSVSVNNFLCFNFVPAKSLDAIVFCFIFKWKKKIYSLFNFKTIYSTQHSLCLNKVNIQMNEIRCIFLLLFFISFLAKEDMTGMYGLEFCQIFINFDWLHWRLICVFQSNSTNFLYSSFFGK